ncbi:MAG: hypothetical protein Q7U36_01445 [bacterium]|nr:hypothetical protein [bacterium]
MPFFRENTVLNKKNVGVGIDIIDSCNLRCKQCFYTKNNGKGNMMSLSQIKNIVEQAKHTFSELYRL